MTGTSSVRLWSLLTALLFAVSAAGGQPPAARDSTRPAGGSGSIAGHVTVVPGGFGLADCVVIVRDMSAGTSRSTRCDEDGAYAIAGLPVGSYTLEAAASGFRASPFAPTTAHPRGSPVAVRAGDQLTRIDFALQRAGAIAGTLLGRRGEPVAGVHVTAIVTRKIGTRIVATPAGSQATSDDLGNYRLFGLPDGRYAVAAWHDADSASEARASSPIATFFPGTPRFDEAQLVELQAGQTADGVSFSLVWAAPVRITGTAVDATGRPRTSGTLRATQHPIALGSPHPTPIGADGSFTLNNLAPGTYRLSASTLGQSTCPEDCTVQTVDAVSDIDGLIVKPSLASVDARVSVHASRDTPLDRNNIRLVLTPAGSGGSSSAAAIGELDASLRSRMRVQAGQFRVTIAGDPKWMVRRITADGADATSGWLTLADASAATLAIELTDQIGETAGVVLDRNGNAAAASAVVMFPQEASEIDLSPGRFAVASADDEGRFRVTTLMPGEYYVLALADADARLLTDAEFLLSQRAAATIVRVEETSKNELRLRVDR